jgi:ribosomal protein S6
MTKYEFLMLTTPGITGDEMGGLEKKFEDLLKQFKGTLVSFDRWGKCRLAYAVKHHDYGIYYMARFEMSEPQMFFKEIKLLLDVKYHELVMRTSTVKIDPKKTFTDFRPDAVEDLPTRNVDQFLRDNKMEGLITKPAKDAAPKEATPVKEEAKPEIKPLETVAQETSSEKKESDSTKEAKPATEDTSTDEGASA